MSEKQIRHRAMIRHVLAQVAFQATILRQSRGWSRAELATKAGVSVEAVTLVERASPKMELEVIKALSSVYDVGLAVHFEPFSNHLVPDHAHDAALAAQAEKPAEDDRKAR